MIRINFDTRKFKEELDKKPQKIQKSVKEESEDIIKLVGGVTYQKAPFWPEHPYPNPHLRDSVYEESKPFINVTENKLKAEIIYDAYNPNTQFHYGFLRHYDNVTGVPYFMKEGMREAEGYVEKILEDAVIRGVMQW